MGSQIVQANELGVYVVDLDGAFDFCQAEEGGDEGGFAGAGTAHDSHLMVNSRGVTNMTRTVELITKVPFPLAGSRCSNFSKPEDRPGCSVDRYL